MSAGGNFSRSSCNDYLVRLVGAVPLLSAQSAGSQLHNYIVDVKKHLLGFDRLHEGSSSSNRFATLVEI